jgi:serine/threonine-protein kinase
MAPEQVQGVTAPDARTDIYAVGVILYELLTGRVPFICDTQFDVLLAHLTAVPRPPIELNERIPPELNALVLTALEKDPARRFASAKAFAEALQRLSPVPKPVVLKAAEPAPEAVVATVSLENLSKAVEVDPTPTEKVEVVLPPPHEQRVETADPVWSTTHLIAAGIAAFIVTIVIFFAVVRSL